MPLPKRSSNHADSTRDMKLRVLTCLNKLSDRDTHSSAATELESIAKALSHDSIPSFISSIAATDASDKSPVRKQCVRLISLLSEAHGNALSPYLSKILSAVVRRLRDQDSAVRSACIDAAGSISLHITKPPFTSILKPLIDSLVTEQDQNSQIGAALCLASAIDASPDPEPLYLKKLLPRLEKLLKCQSFKAKPALLTLIGSIIGAGGASSQQVLKNLVPCLVEFISSDDWAARKAAAEALEKLAVVERHSLSEFKSDCLRTFEAKRFDKVKVARETMNQMVEAWKQIADVGDEVSAPPEESKPSSKEDATDERYPPSSRTSGAPQMRKKNFPASRSAFPNGANMTTVRKRGPLGSNDKKIGPAIFQRLERKKPTDWNIEIASPHTPSTDVVCKDGPKGRNEKVTESDENDRNRFVKPEVKRALFNKNDEDRMHKLGGFKVSRVVPCHDENSGTAVVVSNVSEDIYKNQKESEVLSSIRKQLIQIENQQSSLLDLLQKFIGSSQNGMHSLETRVHGLEMALDEISSDLAVSTRRKSSSDSEGTTCCKLPGAEFLSSKFRRRTDDRHSTSQFFSTNGSPSLAAVHNMGNKKGNPETFKPENKRFRLQGGGGGFIVNPLAEIHGDSMGILEVSSGRFSKNIHNAI